MSARILVVDDEEDICAILKFNLSKEGYDVVTTNSAEEALALDAASFNLLLLDVMMGGMSGFELTRRLKSEPETAGIPVIFITARDTERMTRSKGWIWGRMTTSPSRSRSGRWFPG